VSLIVDRNVVIAKKVRDVHSRLAESESGTSRADLNLGWNDMESLGTQQEPNREKTAPSSAE
jgi:hypothetical protein